MNECEWTRDTCKDLVACGAVVFTNQRPYVVGGRAKLAQVAPAGWPDRWIGHVVWSGWLEFKGDRTPLEPLQARRIRDMQERWPGSAWVARRHPDGTMIEDHEGRRRVLAIGGAESLLLALSHLNTHDEEWIAAQQQRIAQCYRALQARITARGQGAVMMVF